MVSTSDLDSAYRICSVLNDRGLELSHTDILKADIIGNVPESQEVVRRAMDDKEYLLRKVRERFAEQREELTGTANNAGALVRRLEKIETIWANYQRAYAADAISVADLAARRAKLEEERERVKADLERARNLEAELEKLAETERSVCERIQEGYGDLDEAGLQQHREIY